MKGRKLTRSPAGINVRREILKPLGIRLARHDHVKWAPTRQPNVVYGRARTIARLARIDKEAVIQTLRCIQYADPTMLHADVVAACFRYPEGQPPLDQAQ